MSRRPVPLMFVNSPYATARIPVEVEESTSIFVKNEMPKEDQNISLEDQIEEVSDKKTVASSVANQLKKIQSPFGRHLYQPVQIKAHDQQTLFGEIKKIEESVIYLQVEDDEELTAIPAVDVLDIIWRGKSIPEK